MVLNDNCNYLCHSYLALSQVVLAYKLAVPFKTLYDRGPYSYTGIVSIQPSYGVLPVYLCNIVKYNIMIDILLYVSYEI